MPVIPESQRRKLQSPRSNFSLYFSRMTNWNFGRDEVQSMDGAIVDLGAAGNRLLSNTQTYLTCIQQRQHNLVQHTKASGQFALEIRARLKTPFVSGLGSGHPTETGMILDRNTGVPYIPASSIKGVLRLAHAVNLLNDPELENKWIKKGVVTSKGVFKEDSHGDQINLDDRESSLRRYFGDTDTKAKDCVRGQLVFLDAYPEHVPELKPDIMNPHYHAYYDGQKGPEDSDDPIPVKFLTVAEGTVFIFRVLALPLVFEESANKDNALYRPFDDQDLDALTRMFKRAFITLGMGGKTAVGYGRFGILENKNDADSEKNINPALATSSLTTDSLIWDQASVLYNPGSQVLTASQDGKKATAHGKDLVPEKYQNVFFKKKKAITARVTVQVEGNMFQIIKIE